MSYDAVAHPTASHPRWEPPDARLAEALVESERLRAAIRQHREDWKAAIGRETTTRQEMNRRKREANDRLWAALAATDGGITDA